VRWVVGFAGVAREPPVPHQARSTRRPIRELAIEAAFAPSLDSIRGKKGALYAMT